MDKVIKYLSYQILQRYILLNDISWLDLIVHSVVKSQKSVFIFCEEEGGVKERDIFLSDVNDI